MIVQERNPQPANPLGLDGIEFVEYATAQPQALGALLQQLGFAPVARHRSREVMLYRQGTMNVIVNAFGVPPFRIVGEPEWISRERFDIIARIPDAHADGQVLLMLQGLLTQRFKLKAHRETREQPVYEVVVARADRRLGPRLTRSDSDCANNPPAAPPSLDSPCAGLFGVGPAGGRIVSKGRPLARVLSALSMAVSRTVVDRTGLQGPFDVDLQWSADVGTPVTNSDTPSIFTALQEQLGLRLEPSRAPVDVLVIESVERPTPD